MMSTRLAGKRAIVTAAGQGIGRASALAMAREGAHVFATDINTQTLATLQEEAEGQLETFVMDVLDDASVSEGIARARPDVLFNCAGFVHDGSILDAASDDFDFAVNLNVKAMFRTAKAALPGMLERQSGSIINMSSACSSVAAAKSRFIYGTSKAAVIGLTKSIALEYITQGIRCNAICPGVVDSPSLHDRLKATGNYEEAMKLFIARQPMGRIAQPEEIAALVVYLGSDESAYTTGQPHVIDGGFSG